MTSSIFIKGKLLNQHFKAPTEGSNSYFIYQFQVKNNDGLFSIINILSKKDMNIELNKEVDLPISISLFNNQIVYEFKRS